MDEVFVARLRGCGLVPVIVLENVAQARPLAEALWAGDLPILEITLRSEAGLPAIESLAGDSRWTVGAGTVLNRDEARRAIDAGAQFVVAPGLDEATVAYCLDRQVPVTPGVCTATEVQRAFNMGLRLLKFFPAEAFGGATTVKALGGPFSQVQFVPTGGITADQLTSYLKLPNVAAVGGSWMVARELLSTQDYAGVTRLAAAAREQVKAYRPQQSGERC
jgi:2-dehydro-3-deoxyphosphogluconate aldolase/(4S)-4-hydroxy-2-oxoglutarate aldolase